MKKHFTPLLGVLALLYGSTSYAQVGISKDPDFIPNSSAILDASASDRGILIPRLALTSLTSLSPVVTSSAPTSLLVYNTSTVGTDILPGFYYWDATSSPESPRWRPINTDNNLYNTDGTLTSNRVVSQNNNKLVFRDGKSRGTSGETLIIGESSQGNNDQNPSMVFHSGDRRISINKRNPRVTLDIHASLDASATAPEGLLIPKMVRSNLAKKDAIYFARNAGNSNYNDGQNSYEGTLVYIFPDSDDQVTPTTTGKTRLINKEGFYYYGIDDLWHPVGGSSAPEPWRVQGGTAEATSNTQNIYQMGKVAIGAGETALSSTAALYVNGTIETTARLFTPVSVFADYVFQKYYTGNSTLNDQYDFKSLKYVKEFTAKNHHLPGVTPVADILKNENGYRIDLSEMSMQQLEKIEELYLHVIEQQEQIDHKNMEIAQLKTQQEELSDRLKKLEELLENK